MIMTMCKVKSKFNTSRGMLIVIDRPETSIGTGDQLQSDDGSRYIVRGFAEPRGYFPDILSVLVEEQ